MTYCIAIRVNSGVVLLSDTRTNAGVDNISRFRKLFTWTVPGSRAVAMLTSGNLGMTQAVISLLEERIKNPPENGETLLTAPSLFRAAELVGSAMREVQDRYAQGLTAESAASTIVLAGQRIGGAPRIFLIYSAGNFIEATPDTPYFQIGEHKYGKPILDRVISTETSLEDAKTAALLSMDSTLRSNLTVGMPLDLAILPVDRFEFSEHRRIEPDDAEFHRLSNAWSELMIEAFGKARRRAQGVEEDDD